MAQDAVVIDPTSGQLLLDGFGDQDMREAIYYTSQELILLFLLERRNVYIYEYSHRLVFVFLCISHA